MSSPGASSARATGWLSALLPSAEGTVLELDEQDEVEGQQRDGPAGRIAVSAGPRAPDGLLDNPRPTETAVPPGASGARATGWLGALPSSAEGSLEGLEGHDEDLGQQRVGWASGSAARHRGPARSAIPVTVLGGVTRSGGFAVPSGGRTIPRGFQVGQRHGGLPILASQRHIPAAPTARAGIHRGEAAALETAPPYNTSARHFCRIPVR